MKALLSFFVVSYLRATSEELNLSGCKNGDKVSATVYRTNNEIPVFLLCQPLVNGIFNAHECLTNEHSREKYKAYVDPTTILGTTRMEENSIIIRVVGFAFKLEFKAITSHEEKIEILKCMAEKWKPKNGNFF